MISADQMTLAIEDQRAPALRAVIGSALDGIDDTEADYYGETPAAHARAEFWERNGPRLEGRRFALRRPIPDRLDDELTIQRGAVLVWRDGAWRTRYRAGLFSTVPNPYVLRIGDLSPLPNTKVCEPEPSR